MNSMVGLLYNRFYFIDSNISFLNRYIDDVFMTTNSLHQINVQLNKIEKKDENIRITRSIGSTVEFLDVLVENNNGQLRTSVFHKPAAEPYIPEHETGLQEIGLACL